MSSKPGAFRAQISKSSKLLTLRFASNIGLRLISTVVLSRLLAPDVYGIFAVVLVYMYVLEMLSDLGLRTLILTREGEVSKEFLRTCWTISILATCPRVMKREVKPTSSATAALPPGRMDSSPTIMAIRVAEFLRSPLGAFARALSQHSPG